MPNLKSAKKELRKGKKRNLLNKTIKDNVKSLIKKSRKAITGKDEQAKELVAQAMKTIDKAKQKGIIKKNTGDRKKSRLQKKFNDITKKEK